MSRSIAARHCIVGTLTTCTPIHIGAAEKGEDTDLLVQRDAQGRLLIPGTSMAGALRAALRRRRALSNEAPDWDGTGLWGKEDATDWASFVLVEDSVGTGQTLVREHVALDRIHAAAVDSGLFTREIVPIGTDFAFELTVEEPSRKETGDAADPSASGLLDDVIELLSTSGIRVGAAQSRGLGRVQLTQWELWHEDWSSPTGMSAILNASVRRTKGEADALAPDSWCLRVRVEWKPVGAVMSTTAVQAAVADDVPTVTPLADGKAALLLAGSGIKGALGAHMERLARTVAAGNGNHATPSTFPEQIADRFRLPGVAVLLGLPGASGEDPAAPAGRAGALDCLDCLGTARFELADWEQTLIPHGADLPGPAPTDWTAAKAQQAHNGHGAAVADNLPMTVAPHVAIDRWTGGAADGRLFQVLEPNSGSPFAPIELSVDVVALGQDDGPALALLLATLRDFAEGQIPLGAQSTRGLGAIASDTDLVTFQCGAAVPADSLAGRIAACGTLTVLLEHADLVAQMGSALSAAYELGGAA